MFFTFYFLLFTYSCKKDKAKNIDPESGKDFVLAEQSFTNVFKTLTYALQIENSFKSRKPFRKISMTDSVSLMQITASTDTFPKTILITFIGYKSDGVNYNGTIIANLSDKFRNTGSTMSVSFQNFSINNDSIKGQNIIKNTGPNSLGNLVYNVQVNNGLIYISKSNQITYSAVKTYTWLQGDTSLTITDDVWQVSETGNGVNIDKEAFSFSSTTPLTIMMSCEWMIVSGVINITPASRDALIINYGNGVCENFALLYTDNYPAITVNLN